MKRRKLFLPFIFCRGLFLIAAFSVISRIAVKPKITEGEFAFLLPDNWLMKRRLQGEKRTVCFGTEAIGSPRTMSNVVCGANYTQTKS